MGELVPFRSRAESADDDAAAKIVELYGLEAGLRIRLFAHRLPEDARAPVLRVADRAEEMTGRRWYIDVGRGLVDWEDFGPAA